MNRHIYGVLDGVRSRLFNPYCRFLNRVVDSCHSQAVEGICNGQVAGLGDEHELYVVTVAYNKPELIKLQIDYVKKNLTDKDYLYIVVDNSGDFGVRKTIEKICRQENVAYFSVPKSFYRVLFPKLFWYGISQAMALNWFCRKVLPSIPSSKYIAFIDHDLFPLREYSLVEHIGEMPFFGVQCLREGLYYLWSGFAVYDRSRVKSTDFDFMPCFMGKTFYDAGGSNYLSIYSHYKLQKAMFAYPETHRYNKNGGGDYNEVYHRDCFEIIDKAWIHLINGSNYAHLKGKEAVLQRVINHLDSIASKLDKND